MSRWIKREDLIEYALEITPVRSDYFYAGVAETMVLDKQEEIAKQLEKLPCYELPDEIEEHITMEDNI